MPPTSNTDRIRQLEASSTEYDATLKFHDRRLATAETQIEKLREANLSTAPKLAVLEEKWEAVSGRNEILRDADRRIAVLEEKIIALEKASDNSSRIKWAVGTSVASVSLAALLNYLFRLSR